MMVMVAMAVMMVIVERLWRDCDGDGVYDGAGPSSFLSLQVLLDPDLPLGLGGGAHHYLVQHFLCSSLSTKELQRGLQVGGAGGEQPTHPACRGTASGASHCAKSYTFTHTHTHTHTRTCAAPVCHHGALHLVGCECALCECGEVPGGS